MKLLTASLISLCIFALLRFPFLRAAKSAWAKHDLQTKRKKGFSIALLEAAAQFFLVGGATFLLLACLFFYINVQRGGTVQQVAYAIDGLETLKRSLKWVNDVWDNWLIFLSLIVFGFLWMQKGKRRFVEKFDSKVTEKLRALQVLQRDHPDEWNKLDPTAAMRTVRSNLERILSEIQALKTASSAQSARINELTQAAQVLQVLLVQMDFERRIDFPWDLELPPPRSVWDRLVRFVSSRGFMEDMKTVGNVFKYAALGLFFVGLVGVESSSLVQAADARIAQLDDLRVRMSLEDSTEQRKKAEEKAFAEAKQQSSPNSTEAHTLTTEQTVALRAFANDVIAGFAHNPDWVEARTEAKESDDVRKVTVRFAVLEELQPSDAPAVSTVNKDLPGSPYLQAYAKKLVNPDELNPAAQSIVEALTKLPESKRQGFVDKIVDWYTHKRASYREPLSIDEIQATFVEGVIGLLVPQAPKATGDLGDQLRDILSEGLEASGKNAVEILRNVVVLQALNETSPEDILKSTRVTKSEFPFMTRSASRDFRRKLTLFSERIKNEAEFVESAQRQIARMGAPTDENGIAVESLSRLPEEYRKGRETELANLLSNFDSEFPSQGAPVQEFAREKVLSAWGVSNQNDAEMRQKRSTNFEDLQSYSRVGGILFGRSPVGSAPDVQSFSWELSGDSVRLYIQRSETEPFLLGTFRPYLVRQALAYVADQRPTVVTLLNAPEIDRRQVMIHPAFRDTALGCRLIAADQWIFHYTDPNPTNPKSSVVREMINRYEVESELYKRAWDDLNGSELNARAVDIEKVLPFLRPTEDSPLGRAPGMQPELLQLAIRCAASEGKTYDACVKRAGGKAEGTTQLPNRKPQFGFVSQIREAPYSVDNNLDFLKSSSLSSTNPIPLEMTVQMTINDSNYWQLPTFDSIGFPMVVKGLLSDHKTRDVQEIQQLALLQRFFRVILDGGLGPSFPVGKIVQLTAAVKSIDGQQTVITPRWLKERSTGDSVEHEFADEMHKYLREQLPSIVRLSPKESDVVRPLLTTCANTLSTTDVESLSDEVLKSKCQWDRIQRSVEPACAKAYENKKDLDTIESCRILELAISGEKVLMPLHSARLSLNAANAIRADAVSCPPVP